MLSKAICVCDSTKITYYILIIYMEIIRYSWQYFTAFTNLILKLSTKTNLTREKKISLVFFFNFLVWFLHSP